MFSAMLLIWSVIWSVFYSITICCFGVCWGGGYDVLDVCHLLFVAWATPVSGSWMDASSGVFVSALSYLFLLVLSLYLLVPHSLILGCCCLMMAFASSPSPKLYWCLSSFLVRFSLINKVCVHQKRKRKKRIAYTMTLIHTKAESICWSLKYWWWHMYDTCILISTHNQCHDLLRVLI